MAGRLICYYSSGPPRGPRRANSTSGAGLRGAGGGGWGADPGQDARVRLAGGLGRRDSAPCGPRPDPCAGSIRTAASVGELAGVRARAPGCTPGPPAAPPRREGKRGATPQPGERARASAPAPPLPAEPRPLILLGGAPGDRAPRLGAPLAPPAPSPQALARRRRGAQPGREHKGGPVAAAAAPFRAEFKWIFPPRPRRRASMPQRCRAASVDMLWG